MPALQILVIDPQPFSAAGTSFLLGRLGLKSKVACSAGAALDGLASHQFDLVVAACDQPALGGSEFARRQILPRLSKTGLGLIALTADDSKANRARYRQAGASALLVRPLSERKLAVAICDLIQRAALAA